ncbi:MAG: replication factor C large subunit, partial [Candidatus Micrarchaeaceae archaeon]
DSINIELADILGNSLAINALIEFAREVKKGKLPMPLLIFGPPGTGKTAAVLALAKEYDWNIIEFNASDYRDSETLKNKLVPASNSRSIFGKVNLIFMDEIDELAAKFDNGASSVITSLIHNSKSPIIFTANDRWNKRIVFLRNITNPIEFKSLDSDTIEKVLYKIIASNKFVISKDVVKAIVDRSRGDARSAINDLLAVANVESDEILYYLGIRDRKTDIFSTLDKIFFSNTLISPLIAATSVDIDPDLMIKWIDENIPKRYKDKNDLAKAYDYLAKATIFESRAAKLQIYGFWRYMNILMSGGVALSKSAYPSKIEKYSFPNVINQLNKSKDYRDARKNMALLLKNKVNESASRIANEVLPLIKRMVEIEKGKKSKKEIDIALESIYGIGSKDAGFFY